MNIYTPLQLIITYFMIYNITLLIFLNLNTIVLLKNNKTLHSLTNFSFSSYYLLLITILLFSIAGIPPFLGFFSKLIMLITTFVSNFIIFYYLFFIILFITLYFYMQNIRFIHSTNSKKTNLPYLYNEKLVIVFYYISVVWLMVVIMGIIFFDDVNFFILWILN